MIALKVQDLDGPLLARAVALALGMKVENNFPHDWIVHTDADGVRSFGPCGWRPDIDWNIGGPLIEGNRIDVSHCHGPDGDWIAFHDAETEYGKTYLVAAMRVLVASHFGQTMPGEFQ